VDDKAAREELRFFLKDTVRLSVDFSRTAQNLGAPPPPVQKPVPGGAARSPLPVPEAWAAVGDVSLREAIGRPRTCVLCTSDAAHGWRRVAVGGRWSSRNK